jgi:hypothetical protein
MLGDQRGHKRLIAGVTDDKQVALRYRNRSQDCRAPRHARRHRGAREPCGFRLSGAAGDQDRHAGGPLILRNCGVRHRNMAQNNRFECPLLTPQNKRWDLRQHRQQRLHKQCLFSDPSKVGSGPSAGSTDDTDGTDGAFSTCAHLDHSRPRAAFTGCQSRRDTRRHTYRFFPVALAVLPRTTFAAAVGFDALAGSAERVAAALVRRTPG